MNDKYCKVCGDRASGRNFGGLSCDSCKAFFRRTAVKDNIYFCYTNNNCILGPRDRNCKKCRLERCYASGMKRNIELIRTEEELDMRRAMIEGNRRKKQKSFSATTEDLNINSNIDFNIDLNTNSNDSSQESMKSYEENSNFMSDLMTKTISKDDLNEQITEIENYLIDNESDESSDHTYHKMINELDVIPVFQHIITYNVFNELEINRLLELFSAANIFISGPLYPMVKKDITEVSQLYNHIPNLLVKNIKTTIYFAKNLSLCQELFEDDKKYLVRYGYSDVRLLRSIFYYNFEDQYWTVNTEYYPRMKAFIDTLDAEWDRDQVVLDLLTAIVFFNPNRPKLNYRDIVKLQQYIYMYLLQRYLLLKHQSESEAQQKFCKFMDNLNELEVLGDIKRNIFPLIPYT
ncbi:unnamed protein product [Oppiella nova]|uniref:Uncharacterized protein n=1 Tax=Oppiella nova TaxID=334625 RepID=A0A7R9QNJ9_9ACAR|nr:unnamed protein product [Oppiella nova]CAG2169650.1 unnamed protein product [Oppiella nova]